MNVKIRKQPAWITLEGKTPLPATGIPRAEEVLNKELNFDFNFLPLQDPKSFLAGQIHSCVPEWESIINEHLSENDKILQWLKNGIDILEFFQAYKGSFKLPKQFFQNSSICKQYSDFIARELTDKIKCGAIRLLGRVGECQPPRVVMPLTVEPSKPRLCHDERYINLWIKDHRNFKGHS